MPVYAFTSILATACCILAATLLLVNSRKQGWSLALLLCAVGFWMAHPWALYKFRDIDSLGLFRSFYAVGLCVPPLVLLFAWTTLPQPTARPSFLLSIAISLSFSTFLFDRSFFASLDRTAGNVLPIPGPLYAAFTIYFMAAGIYALAAIVRTYGLAAIWQRSRLKWMATALTLAGIGFVVHFAAIGTGKEPLSHDYWVIAFAFSAGYALLPRRLYEIELMTRQAATTVVTAVLAALPLLLGRVFAPVVDGLPAIARFEAVCTLLAALAFFSVAVTLVRYSENVPTRHLSRLFLFASLLNSVFFMWAVPRNAFSIPVLRLTYLLMGLTVMAWIEYRRAYFEESSGREFSLYRVWRWASYAWLLVAATTPYVLRGLEYYLTTRRPYAVIPGPAHFYYHLWWDLSFAAAALWTGQRFWNLSGNTRKSAGIMIGTLIAGGLTVTLTTTYALGFFKSPWHITLELLTAAGILATFLRQPHSGRHPTPGMLATVFMSTMVSCLSGFLLFQGLWMQLLAGLLLAFSMPKIVSQFRHSAQALVDHYVFKKKFSYLNELQQMGDDIFRSANLPGLLRRLADELADLSKLSWAGVWLYDVSEARFLLRQAAGSQNTHWDASNSHNLSFKPDDALPQSFQAEHGLLVTDELRVLSSDGKIRQDSLEMRTLEAFKKSDMAAAFPLHWGSKLIGFLGLGPKEDGSLFHQADRDSLNALGHKAARAVGQAYMLYEQSLMFSKLAHDSLTFLQAMEMNMDILHKEYLGPLNDRQKKQLSIAAHQRELMRESLVDLRELERIMLLRMQGTWKMNPCDLNEIADQSVTVFGPRAAAQNLTLAKVAGPMLQALGEPRAMRRIIDNLLVNALKFTPAGGHIEVRLYQKGKNLRLAVTDTGPGIPEIELPRLFDPFYQPSNPEMPRGTGLGLSVVKEIVAIHGGRIDVTSILGAGTTFFVELPSVLRQDEWAAKATASLAAFQDSPKN